MTHYDSLKESEAATELARRQELDSGEESAKEFYRQEAAEKMQEFKERFITPLIELRSLPTDCLIFANSYGYLIGCHSQKDLVKRHRKDPKAKSNVSKYIKQFARRIKLPSVAGQRDEAGCKNMSDARKEQLQPKT
jgi:hypothetical protein